MSPTSSWTRPSSRSTDSRPRCWTSTLDQAAISAGEAQAAGEAAATALESGQDTLSQASEATLARTQAAIDGLDRTMEVMATHGYV